MNRGDLTNRQYLQTLREIAKSISKDVENPDWIRAYLDLASAVDRLDAMYARCEVTEKECTAPDCDCDENSGCQAQDP